MLGDFKDTAQQATKTLSEVERTALQVRTVTLPKANAILDNLLAITGTVRALVEAFKK